MDKAAVESFLLKINPFMRTDVGEKTDVDFGIAICSRFGKVRHCHAWHVKNRYNPRDWQTFGYDKFDSVTSAKSWLEVMEIIHG